MRPIIESPYHVGVVESTGDGVFLLEALHQDRVLGDLRRDDLDGNELRGAGVAGLIDGAHAAFGNLLEEDRTCRRFARQACWCPRSFRNSTEKRVPHAGGARTPCLAKPVHTRHSILLRIQASSAAKSRNSDTCKGCALSTMRRRYQLSR